MSSPLPLILRDIAGQLSLLEETLEKEYTALAENDLDTIVHTAEDKLHLFESLEALEKKRHAVLLAAGLDLDSSGIRDWLQRNEATEDNHAVSDWQRIETLSEQCRKQNRINGILLEKNRRRVEQALSILKGQTPQAGTYTARGETSHTPSRHSLAKA